MWASSEVTKKQRSNNEQDSDTLHKLILDYHQYAKGSEDENETLAQQALQAASTLIEANPQVLLSNI